MHLNDKSRPITSESASNYLNINNEMDEMNNFDMRRSMGNTGNSINSRQSNDYNKTANSQKNIYQNTMNQYNNK